MSVGKTFYKPALPFCLHCENWDESHRRPAAPQLSTGRLAHSKDATLVTGQPHLWSVNLTCQRLHSLSETSVLALSLSRKQARAIKAKFAA